MNLPYAERGKLFRDSFSYIRRMQEFAPRFENEFGSPDGGMDMLPKPVGGRLPLLITGSSQQSPDWIAHNGDGWMTYPRSPAAQAEVVREWRARNAAAGQLDKPAMQSLYIDLQDSDDAAPEPIHLGLRLGPGQLQEHLKKLENAGINHVALNLRFNEADVEDTLRRLAKDVLPEFESPKVRT